MNGSVSFLPPYVSTRRTYFILSLLLAVTAGLSAMSAGFEISEIRLLSHVLRNQTVSFEQRWAHGVTRNILLVSRSVVFFATAITFIAWLHRSRINARAFGCRRFRYSRVWAITGFVTPLVNLFRPLQVVSEIWQASDPRAMETTIDWKTAPIPGFVFLWWYMLIACTCLQLMGMGLTSSAGVTLEHIRVARGVTTIADLATGIAAFLGYFVVFGIYTAQQVKWAIICGESAPAKAMAQRAASSPAHTQHAAANPR